MASSQKSVELVIKARDETRRALQSAKTALDGFAAAQARTAARRGQFALLEREAREVDAALEAASRSAADLGRQMSSASRPSKMLKADFAAAREEVRRLKAEMLGIAVAGGRMNGRVGKQGSFAQFDQGIVARQGADQAAIAADRLGAAIGRVAAYQQRVSRFAAFDEIARGARSADTALDGLARDLPAIAAAQDRLATSTNKATAALNAQGRAGGGDMASRMVGRTSTRQGGAMRIGMDDVRPWQMQNLGYQANDVISGLAMGQAPMQVFAQQIGQITQLLPRTTAAFLRMVPAIAVVTAVIAPFIAALGKANDAAKNLSTFDQLLTRSGEAASYTAPQLAALARDLDDAGASAAGARAAFSEFVNDSVDPEYMRRFGNVALDTAKVLGIDLTDAAKKVSDAFTGDADAILALDDELNFLTDTERAHIELLRESKRDAEARTEAFAIFERRYGETADKMRGPWSTILNNFGDSWGALVDRINETDFGQIGAKIDWLMGKLAALTARLPGAGLDTSEGVQGNIERNNRDIILANQRRQVALSTPGPNAEREALGETEYINRLGRQNRYLQTRLVTLGALNGEGLLGPTPGPADTTRDPPRAANSSRGGGGRDRVTETERLAKLQMEFNEDLLAQNAARAQDIINLQLAARELEIVTAIEQARAKAADAQLVFSTDQEAAIRQSVGALFDAKIEQEAFNAVSAAALELAERRGEVEERAAYIARGLAEERLTIETAIGRARADQLGQAYDLDQKARDIANSEKTVSDLLTRRTELQNQLTFADEQGNVAASEALRSELESVNAHLLLAVNNSILFWRSMGGPEAEAAILALEGYRKGIESAGRSAIVTARQIDGMIADGGVGAWDDFWNAVGEGKDAFESAGDAFRAFAADFLKQIGGMIAKQMILNALQASSGGGGGSGNIIASAVQSLFKHSGGLASEGGTSRMMPAAVFANARRYHTGGMPGLKANEVPVITENTEGIFTKGQMAALAPAGSGGQVKIVNVFDPTELLDRALGTSGGERVLLNFVSRNSGAFKAAIG